MDPTPTTPSTPSSADVLNKEVIKHKAVSLDNLVMILEEAYKKLNDINHANLILAIGSTGCGKSTMLTSLMFGSDALENKKTKKEIEVPMPGGGFKKKMIVQTAIDQKENQGVFHIGHSSAESKTFMPQPYKRPEDTTNTIYVDIAGTQDTGTDLIELVNIFVTKEIFRKSKTVRFLVPITHLLVVDARGKGPREQIKLIQQICEADLLQIIDSIQPVITRVKQNDEDFDIVHIRETLKKQFEQELQNQINSQERAKQEEFADDDENEEQLAEQNDDQVAENAKNEELAKFYNIFADKMIAFDPMDRPIPSEENDQMTKRDELVDLLENKMADKAISGFMLQTPMMDETFDILMNLFDQSHKECTEISEQYIDEAKTKGRDFKEKFTEHPKVKNYLKVLEFFEKNQLIKDADIRLEEFKGYMSKIDKIIDQEKEFNQMTSTSQFLTQSIKDMVNRFGDKSNRSAKNRNMTSFVKIMLNLQEFIDKNRKVDNDDPRARDQLEQFDQTEAEIHEFLKTKIKYDYQVLPEFAFELRQQDNEDDYYTEKYLSDIKPQFLYDIIISNKFNKTMKNMATRNGPFQLTVGEFRNVFQYQETDQRTKKVDPFLKKNPSKSQKFSGDVRIYLTKTGFQIGNGIKKLLPQYLSVEARSYQRMVWAQANYSHSPVNGPYSSFVFEPVDPKDHTKGYRLFVSRGYEPAYLVANTVNPIFYCRLCMSNRKRDGIDKPNHNTWFFNRKN